MLIEHSGWLTAINDAAQPGADLFAMQLVYGAGDAGFDSGYANGAGANWNGNITMIRYKTASQTNRQVVGYFYDTHDRLMAAGSGEQNSNEREVLSSTSSMRQNSRTSQIDVYLSAGNTTTGHETKDIIFGYAGNEY